MFSVVTMSLVGMIALVVLALIHHLERLGFGNINIASAGKCDNAQVTKPAASVNNRNRDNDAKRQGASDFPDGGNGSHYPVIDTNLWP